MADLISRNPEALDPLRPDFPGNVSASLVQSVEFNNHPQRARQIFADLLFRIQKTWLFLRSDPPGSARARRVHSLVDEEIERALPKMKVSCKQGCSNCCYLLVDVTPDEAVLLAERVRAGVDVDRARLEEQAEARGHEGWRELEREKRACVFLAADGNCRVYDDRPLTCRKYFVTSPPVQCYQLEAEAHRSVVTPAEILASGAFNLTRRGAVPLPEALLAELGGAS
jgi:Fe-S-cluster containining protein